eukprot:4100750-Pleurochrysis_carterae.AAC.2
MAQELCVRIPLISPSVGTQADALCAAPPQLTRLVALLSLHLRRRPCLHPRPSRHASLRPDATAALTSTLLSVCERRIQPTQHRQGCTSCRHPPAAVDPAIDGPSPANFRFLSCTFRSVSPRFPQFATSATTATAAAAAATSASATATTTLWEESIAQGATKSQVVREASKRVACGISGPHKVRASVGKGVDDGGGRQLRQHVASIGKDDERRLHIANELAQHARLER